jgi:hypothetical protein
LAQRDIAIVLIHVRFWGKADIANWRRHVRYPALSFASTYQLILKTSALSNIVRPFDRPS